MRAFGLETWVVALAQNRVDTRNVQNIDPKMVKNGRFLGVFGEISLLDTRCRSRILEHERVSEKIVLGVC